MRKLNYLFYIFILPLIFCSLITASFAWFYASNEISTNLTASSISNYFADGDGTQGDPFILNAPRHVYNLAWLQNLGEFNKDTTVYFKLEDNIDMAGSLGAGALPPIGTSTTPFVGDFDGNGYTISNIWVSSNPSDWQENPEGYNDYNVGEDIGFFGNVDSTATIHDFFLENIEVTNNIANADVGFIAGHVGASMNQVGVKNGSFSFTGGSANSEVSLIGKIGDGVVWSDKPHDANLPNNGLLINPSGDGTSSVGNGKVPVGATIIEGAGTPDTSDDKYSAYYYGSVSATTPNPQPKGAYVYRGGNIEFNGSSTTYKIASGQTEKLSAQTQNVDESFKNLYLNKTNPDGTTFTSFNYVNISGSLTLSGTKPNNCIWFKPQTTGTCVIAFMKTDNSADNVYGAIYRFKRSSNGNIDASTKQAINLNMPKKSGGVGNGEIAYFQFTISDLNYEYAIANTELTGSVANAKFVYLRLAGAGESSDDVPEGTPVLQDIDFMEIIPTSLAGATKEAKTAYWADYEVHTTLLSYQGATGGNMYYNALQSDGLVHYCSQGSATITESITSAESTQSAYSTGTFPPRQTTSS